LSAGAVGASAQAPAPLTLDPNIAALGTALVIAADDTVLSRDGQWPSSLVFALPRGTRLDPASRRQRCTAAEAGRGTCPAESEIGFGRYVVDVEGFLLPGGDTQLTWSIAAYLGTPAQRGDPASVVLSSTLLSADSVAALLTPDLGTSVPRVATTTGRLVRRGSGAYGIELRFTQLPAELNVAAPITAKPSRLELSLSAVRRTRQNFIRRIRVRTPTGYVVEKIRDHRLIGHDLFRTPATCRSSWPYELRVGFADGVKRSAGSFACAKALSAATSAARRRGGSSRR
jgi:hypothetical protein